MTEKKETVRKAVATKAAGEKKAAPKRSAAKITEEDTLLGMGWLFKEGKIKAEANKITLA